MHYIPTSLSVDGAIIQTSGIGASEDVYLDLSKNELRQAVVQVLSSAPSSPVSGQVYFDTVEKALGIYTSTGWTYVKLGKTTAATTDVSVNSHKITDLSTCTADTDAANKLYVDSSITGMVWKDVKVATTAPLTLPYTGLPTIDGYVVQEGDVVMLKNQTNAAENGLYTASNLGAWTRASIMDVWSEVYGSFEVVYNGTLNAGMWKTSAVQSGTIGTTSINFSKIPVVSYTAGNGIVITSNAITINPDNTSIYLNGTYVAVKLNSTNPCLDATNGLKVLTESNSIDTSSNSIAVKVNTTKGIAKDSSGLYVEVDGTSIGYTAGGLLETKSSQKIAKKVFKGPASAGTSFACAHSLSDTNLNHSTQVFRISDGSQVYPTITRGANSDTVSFSRSQAINSYRVVCTLFGNSDDTL